MIWASDMRKLTFLLRGTGGKSSGIPKDGPVWLVQEATCD